MQTMTMGAMSVHMVNLAGEPWFYAPTLAQVLEYKDAFNMLRMVKDDEKAVFKVKVPSALCAEASPSLNAVEGGSSSEYPSPSQSEVEGGPIRDANLVNESGFYRVVMNSRSDVAEPFRKWVFREVLPSIRKTGQYRIVQEAKRLGHSMDFSDDQWDWLKERPALVDVIPLALAGYNSVQINRMLKLGGHPSGVTVRKQIDKLKELGFLPRLIEPRAKQLERRIKATLAAALPQLTH